MGNHFRVSARTLMHLGAELITSNAIALNELLKNAFDAKSPRVKFSFDVPINPIAARHVANHVENKTTTPAAAKDELIKLIRSPQAAGTLESDFQNLPGTPKECAEEIRRIAARHCSITVEDTGAGMGHDDIRDAFLTVGTPVKLLQKQAGKPSKRPLLGDKGIGRLSMMRLGRYASVISSKHGETFTHYVEFDWEAFHDPEKFIEEVPVEVKRGAKKDNQNSSGTTIKIHDLSSAWSEDDVTDFVNEYLRRLRDPFVEVNDEFPIDVYLNGKRLPITPIPDWLVAEAHLKATWKFLPNGVANLKADSVVLIRELAWRKQTSDRQEWTLAELERRLAISQEELIRIGKFDASCYWFNRRLLNKPIGDFKVSEIKNELNIWCGGFSIFRDGFRIGWTGTEYEDWLRLDAGALRHGSFLVNRIQTVGSVAISQKHNPALIDAANREGLLQCPEFTALQKIMNVVVLEDLRNIIAKEQELEQKALLTEVSAEASIERAEKDFDKTRKLVANLKQHVPEPVRQNVSVIEEQLHQHVDYVKKVREALMLAREQKTQVLELAGLGMSVDIVAHELLRTTERVDELIKEIQRTKDANRINELIDSLKAQLKAIDKRLRAIDPLSPSGRHRKEKFDLVRFTKGMLEGYEPRFKRHYIAASLTVDGGLPTSELEVNLVKGLLAHVLENLISNSVYWLKQARAPWATERRISIEIDRKARTLEFSDTGPGIDPRHREDVFSPYFSRKENGRGLGLFIARELSEYHSAHLSLLDAKDDDGRLRTFVLELPES